MSNAICLLTSLSHLGFAKRAKMGGIIYLLAMVSTSGSNSAQMRLLFEPQQQCGCSIPLIDLANQKHRQVIVEKVQGKYIGQPYFKLEEINSMALELNKSENVRTNSTKLEMANVFISGDYYHTYRIPAVVVTEKGTVLAFCEGRQSRSDHSQNDIVLKRSTDGGKTWSPLQVISEDGEDCLNNPQAVVIRETGRVVLMYVRFPKGFHTRAVVPGYDSEPICRVFQTHSDDDGLTWCKTREITRMVKRPKEVTTAAPGIGVGIQLRRGPYAGRIIMPFVNQFWPGRNACAVYSDDLGTTWEYGDYPPLQSKGMCGEVQMVELVDGSIQLNARSYKGNKHRKTAISRNGGQTWSQLADSTVLTEPECQASILRYTDPLDGLKSRILFANPASQKGRRNGTVRLSYDEGKTWPITKTVYSGGFAYCCLTVLPDRAIGCLFERDDYKAITFARFTLAWLTDGKDQSLLSCPRTN